MLWEKNKRKKKGEKNETSSWINGSSLIYKKKSEETEGKTKPRGAAVAFVTGATLSLLYQVSWTQAWFPHAIESSVSERVH